MTKMIHGNLYVDAYGQVIPQTLNEDGVTFTPLANGDTSNTNFLHTELIIDAFGFPIPFQYYDVERNEFFPGLPEGFGGGGSSPVPPIVVNGSANTVEELPEGLAAGSTYLVGTHLYSYNGEVWTDQGNIQGPTGSIGPRGEKGDIGPVGLRGEIGDTGSIGPIGETGLRGLPGNDGKDGRDGSTGPVGETGPIGPRGSTGDRGDTGSIGPVGSTGPRGLTGDTGIQGARGEMGISGSQGERGPAGVQGERGPRGENFEISRTYGSDVNLAIVAITDGVPNGGFILIASEDEENGKLYVKHENEYVFQSQLIGVKGDTGERGLEGPAGIQGIPGNIGMDGIQGPAGVRGETGPGINVLGTLENEGAVTSQLLAGNNRLGDTYWTEQGRQYTYTDDPRLVASPTFTRGPSLVGPAGRDGERGIDGATGATGARGIQGERGIAGMDGLPGQQGVAGPQGVPGAQGIRGATGADGLTPAIVPGDYAYFSGASTSSWSLDAVNNTRIAMTLSSSRGITASGNTFTLRGGKTYLIDLSFAVYTAATTGVIRIGIFNAATNNVADGDKITVGTGVGDRAKTSSSAIISPSVDTSYYVGVEKNSPAGSFNYYSRNMTIVEVGTGAKGDTGATGATGPTGPAAVVSNATTTTKGIVQVGSGLAVNAGVVSVNTSVVNPPKQYLSCINNTARTVGTTATDIVFDKNVNSSGITYNTATGEFNLTAGKVYKIQFTASLSGTGTFNVNVVNSSNSTTNGGSSSFVGGQNCTLTTTLRIDVGGNYKIRTSGATGSTVVKTYQGLLDITEV